MTSFRKIELCFLFVVVLVGCCLEQTAGLEASEGAENNKPTTVQVLEDGPIPKNLRGPLHDMVSIEGDGDGSILDALSSSFLMIMVSELGDETFIIAAIMAMRQSRTIVLFGALGALYVMTVLSTALGYIVPNLITRETAHNIATYIYIFFGLRLYYIAFTAEESTTEEIEEVEEKLSGSKGEKEGLRGFLKVLVNPVFLEAFLLTFSAEWGDRSQIATIALAAHKNPYAVTLGACIGHTICTSIAVWGGRLVAKQISQRTVAIAGGTTFFFFAAYNIMFGLD